jgi:uncharacterized protein (DUF433 family)
MVGPRRRQEASAAFGKDRWRGNLVRSRKGRHTDNAQVGVPPGRNDAINRAVAEGRRYATEAPVTTHERIEIDPEIMGGKPVIRGTRVPVETILRKLGAGMTPEAIVADHPRLAPDDIRAAQAFAADYLADEALVYG